MNSLNHLKIIIGCIVSKDSNQKDCLESKNLDLRKIVDFKQSRWFVNLKKFSILIQKKEFCSGTKKFITKKLFKKVISRITFLWSLSKVIKHKMKKFISKSNHFTADLMLLSRNKLKQN